MEKQKTSKRARGEMFQAYGFLAPALLVILIFFVLSILFAVYLSFNFKGNHDNEYLVNSTLFYDHLSGFFG